MNKKKIIMILVLVFVLILGGAGILYKQLGQKLAPNLLATQTPQETFLCCVLHHLQNRRYRWAAWEAGRVI
ncbi:hypothetical protein ACTNEW_14880 [Blautia sp. HCP3S3_G3]|uniref:hypothetical protein n=1 Tax=Blautia sp. HCP3S3_G3 TaxID=3438913 RepID=UPI003F8C5665